MDVRMAAEYIDSASRTLEIERVYAKQRERADARIRVTTARERIDRIRALHDTILARRREIHDALYADFRRVPEETDLADILPAVSEARHAMRHLARWMAPRRVSTPLSLLGSRSYIAYEPKGMVLILSPWNVPINLTFGPLVSAIAAGNCAILKPSEITPHASACMKGIVSDIFDESEAAIIEGDASVAQELLRRRFDHIFFTGGTAIGKIVMKAAAEHLTSVTLELGGKSPAIVDETADIREAAKKIAWGKFLNCGQLCISPDYVLVQESVRVPFVEALREESRDTGGWLVNERHAQRVKGLLDEAIAGGATVLKGGHFENRRLEPTIIADVPPDSAIMREEIFGPVLPIVTITTRDEAVRMINEREKPLVMYVFSRNRAIVDEYLRDTRAGGSVVNDTLIHFGQLNLPFGGVGHSGMGRAHGFFGFEAFSNPRGILEQPWKFSGIQLLYPPFNAFKRRMIDFMLRYL